MAKMPVDALLALDSGLRTFQISFDKFLQPFNGDPFLLGPDLLQDLDLLAVPALVFLSDREGSQLLVKAVKSSQWLDDSSEPVTQWVSPDLSKM